MNNYIYPLQPRDELLAQINSIPLQQQAIQQDMLHVDPPVSQVCDPPINSHGNNKSSSDPPGNPKKSVHRDVERQRRQEINSLYTSLRSLLPLEFIKGKRSISDHMHEATNYIKHLEKKNQELRNKRDKLKRLPNSSTIDSATEGLSRSDLVTVARCWQGMEVVVSSRLKDGVVSLSRVLEILAEEGLTAASCVSSVVNERFIHTIQAEVRDPAAITDTFGLQQKMMNLVRSTS